MITLRLILFFFFFAAVSYGDISRYALIIGHNNGGKSVDKLRFAEEDAKRFSELLISLGGFDSAHITLLLHPETTHIAQTFQDFKNNVYQNQTPEQTLFLFYYSGHANGQNLLLGNEEYSLASIKEHLSTMPSGITIGIFDACQSGAMTKFKGGKRIEPFYLKTQEVVKGQVIIASSAARELAQESDILKGSVFTHHWINGLRGSADISGDKKVTLNEAYQYAYRKTVETTALSGGDIQHPMYKFNINGQGDITLTSFLHKGTGIVFDQSFKGKFLVFSDQYTNIYADFFKKPGQKEVFISLNPGRYTAINIIGKETMLHHFQIRDSQLYQVYQSSFVKNALAQSRIKGLPQDKTESEENIHTTPLSVYSFGVGFGGAGALYQPLRDKAPFGKVMFSNQWYVKNQLHIFLNTFWLIPDTHFGLDAGLTYRWITNIMQPMVGIGTGIYRFENKHASFSDEIGPSFVMYTGFYKEMTDRVSVQVQIPWMVCFNKKRDMVLGLDVVFFLSGKYKNINVLKLEYTDPQ